MSSGFVSENELAERRRVRQEEWEKVRTADQPTDVPDEEYDPRSLFDRLKEQRDKKEYEYEETHKLKNMIRGLDDDEVGFLELVDKTKMAEERRQMLEESREIEEFRAKVSVLQCETNIFPLEATIPKPPPAATGNGEKKTQSKLLAGAVVKKRSSDESTTNVLKKLKPSTDEPQKSPKKAADESKSIVLPGLVAYSTDSDTSDSDE